MWIHQANDVFLHCLDRLLYPKEKLSKLTYVNKFQPPRQPAKYVQKIPLYVWQTWKTIHLPPRLARVVLRFRRVNPEYSHYLYSDKDCDNFIEEHYSGTNTESAYFRINPSYGAARSDFWRYCVLYKMGGIYIDIDSTCKVPLRQIIRSNDQAVLSHEHNHINTWQTELSKMALQNFLENVPYGHLNNPEYVLLQWLLIYEPMHPFLGNTIEYMSDYILNVPCHYFDAQTSSHLQTLVLTGPLRYTDSIWKTLATTQNNYKFRINGFDHGKNGIFQYWGQEDKNRQSTHYTNLSESILIDNRNR